MLALNTIRPVFERRTFPQRIGMALFMLLIPAWVLYWDWCVSSVRIHNRSEQAIGSVRVKLGDVLLFTGSLAPHQDRIFYGQAMRGPSLRVSFQADGRAVDGNYGYVMGGLGDAFVVDIISSSDVRSRTCYPDLIFLPFFALSGNHSFEEMMTCRWRAPDPVPGRT